MSTTTVRLLQSASEIVGGNKALAGRLGISESLLSRFLADSHELPDPLLLRAVDIVLEDRHLRYSPGAASTAKVDTRVALCQVYPDNMTALPEALEKPDNGGLGSDATARTGAT